MIPKEDGRGCTHQDNVGLRLREQPPPGTMPVPYRQEIEPWSILHLLSLETTSITSAHNPWSTTSHMAPTNARLSVMSLEGGELEACGESIYRVPVFLVSSTELEGSQ